MLSKATHFVLSPTLCSFAQPLKAWNPPRVNLSRIAKTELCSIVWSATLAETRAHKSLPSSSLSWMPRHEPLLNVPPRPIGYTADTDLGGAASSAEQKQQAKLRQPYPNYLRTVYAEFPFRHLNMMNTEVWDRCIRKAAKGELGPPFPAGELTGPSEVSQDSLTGFMWTHLPSSGSNPVAISILQTKSKDKAAAYWTKFKNNDGAWSGWTDWPKGFPDNGNDYENCSHCGIAHAAPAGLAAWVQDYDKVSYVVVLKGGNGGLNGFDGDADSGATYADPLFSTVYEAGVRLFTDNPQ